MKRVLLSVLGLGGVLLMGCHQDSVAQEAWQQTLCQPDAAFPSSVPLTKADAAVGTLFGPVCSGGIVKLQGLRFKEARDAYLCQGFVARENPEPAITTQFGAENLAKADIMRREGFLGAAFAAIILTDTTGKPDAVVLRRTVLEPLLEGLETSAAAAVWAQLLGHGGESAHLAGYCNAMIKPIEAGWHFAGVESFRNCRPSEILELEVTRMGKVTVLSRQEKKNADGSVSITCVD